MNIHHIGHSSLQTPVQSLQLNNVLHIPQVTRNLLSIHRLANDNNIFFEFHPSYFLVKDRLTKRLLLQGKCERGLYPIKPRCIALSKKALLTSKPSQGQWHCRLGHPSSSIVQQVLHSNNLPHVSNSTNNYVYNALQQAKSHQLPFTSSNNTSSSPLEFVFSDV